MLKFFILFLIASNAWADSIDIRLNAQFWSKENEKITLHGEAIPFSLKLETPSEGEFDLRKIALKSETLTVQVTLILLVREKPNSVVFQTLLSDAQGAPLAQCSNLQTEMAGAVYGVGACSGFQAGKQLGVTFYRAP